MLHQCVVFCNKLLQTIFTCTKLHSTNQSVEVGLTGEHMKTCDECETVKHCLEHGCVPKKDFWEGYEPEPVRTDAWPCLIAEADFQQNTITLEMQCSDYKVGVGQHWLHTTPPAAKRTWVGLTDDEMDELVNRFARYELARATENLLRSKNT
jgi:hypothetical protein